MNEMIFKFAVGQQVRIKPLENFGGLVVGIWIGFDGVQYKVRYFAAGKAEEVYFLESELESKP